MIWNFYIRDFSINFVYFRNTWSQHEGTNWHYFEIIQSNLTEFIISLIRTRPFLFFLSGLIPLLLDFQSNLGYSTWLSCDDLQFYCFVCSYSPTRAWVVCICSWTCLFSVCHASLSRNLSRASVGQKPLSQRETMILTIHFRMGCAYVHQMQSNTRARILDNCILQI